MRACRRLSRRVARLCHVSRVCAPQLGRLIEEDRRAREQALRAEAEKIYEYGQQEDEKRKKVYSFACLHATQFWR